MDYPQTSADIFTNDLGRLWHSMTPSGILASKAPTKSEAASQSAAYKTARAGQDDPWGYRDEGASRAIYTAGNQDRGTGEARNNGMSPYAEWSSTPTPGPKMTDLSDANNTITKTSRNSYEGQGKGAPNPLNDFFTGLLQKAQAIRAQGANGGGTLGSSLAVGNIARLLATLGPAMQMQNIQLPQLGLEGRRVALAERTAGPQNDVNAAAAHLALGGDPESAAVLKRGNAGEIPQPTTFAPMMSQPFNSMYGQPSGPLIFPQDPSKYAEQARQAQQNAPRGNGAVRPQQ